MNKQSVPQGALSQAASGELKVYCYDEGFCISALSIDDAKRYIGELLPWPTTEMDATLVREIDSEELDEKRHWYWDEKSEAEKICSFRTEIERRMAEGKIEPCTFYDNMCLIPDHPSYVFHGWVPMRHLYLPTLGKPVWTTDGATIVRGLCHATPGKSIRDHFYWGDENGSAINVTHWRSLEDSPLEPKLPETD